MGQSLRGGFSTRIAGRGSTCSPQSPAPGFGEKYWSLPASRLAPQPRLKFFLLEAVEAGGGPRRVSIGTENPIPEEMDHSEIAVRVPVMNEVQLLFPPEPRKPLKSRSL